MFKTLINLIVLASLVSPVFAQVQQAPVLKDGRVSAEIRNNRRNINPCQSAANLVEASNKQNAPPMATRSIATVSTRVFSSTDPIPQSMVDIRSQSLQSSSQPSDGETNRFKDYVSVSVLTNLGPIGEVYKPTGLGFFEKASKEREAKYFYPSIFFDISASPLLYPILTGDNESEHYDKLIGNVLNVGADMKWMDVGIELTAWCDGTTCPKDPIRLLEIMPNETRGGTKESIPAQAAGALTETAKLTAPFFPATTFEDKFTAGAGGLSILFNNLFPPKTLTFFHAYIDSPVRFGWNFRQNKQKPEQASIMGLHRGIAVLQADPAVTAVWVKYVALSEWNHKVNSEGKKIHRRTGDLCVMFPPEKGDAPIKYEKLTDLGAFPALIPQEQVEKILHISAQEYSTLIAEGGPLKATPSGAFVKKASIEEYLGLRKPKPAKEESGTEGEE